MGWSHDIWNKLIFNLFPNCYLSHLICISHLTKSLYLSIFFVCFHYKIEYHVYLNLNLTINHNLYFTINYKFHQSTSQIVFTCLSFSLNCVKNAIMPKVFYQNALRLLVLSSMSCLSWTSDNRGSICSVEFAIVGLNKHFIFVQAGLTHWKK